MVAVIDACKKYSILDIQFIYEYLKVKPYLACRALWRNMDNGIIGVPKVSYLLMLPKSETDNLANQYILLTKSRVRMFLLKTVLEQ